jgi:hypothetical protein
VRPRGACGPAPVGVPLPGGRDDPRSAVGGELHDRGADIARASAADDRLAHLQAGLAVEPKAGGGRGVERGDRRDGVGTVREGIQPLDGDRDTLGERALATVVAQAVAPHAIADREPFCARTHLDHGADEIPADDEREWRRRGYQPDRM